MQHFALYFPASPFFRVWQPFTHLFMHGGFSHIFFNMWSLFIFGSVLERVWGPKKFLIFYFATGLGAAAVHIEEEMSDTAMHEHVGKRLPPMIERRGRIEKRELCKHELPIEGNHHHYQSVDNDNVLYSCGDIAHKAAPVSI